MSCNHQTPSNLRHHGNGSRRQQHLRRHQGDRRHHQGDRHHLKSQIRLQICHRTRSESTSLEENSHILQANFKICLIPRTQVITLNV